MAVDPNGIEQAVSRTLRDNLEKIQRTVDELHQSVNDLVSACASSRPSNALPSMIRAQTTAASLTSTLDILSRLVTGAMQSSFRPQYEPEPVYVPSIHPPIPPAPFEQPEPAALHLKAESPWGLPAPSIEPAAEPPAFSAADLTAKSDFPPVVEMPPMAEFAPSMEPVFLSEPVQVFAVEHVAEPIAEIEAEAEPPAAFAEPPASELAEAEPKFNLDSLLPEEQELHRRAYRVAKVSMQDIKMLRPEDVRVGRENKDLCIRLRDDIEKAHKEYDRRFQSIQSHPVDYFYDWMVEILGGGDAQTLGEYPYPSPVMHH
jgi:uncharacterized damage-inducible protein DinB